MLFCAAQAPELFGRDQRYGVLPLYFSRVLTRADYAVARLAGLFLAVLVVCLLPQLVLTVGGVLAATDPATGLAGEAARHPPGDRDQRACRRPARGCRGGRRCLDPTPCLRDGRDHRGLHHPAHRRRHRRGAGTRGRRRTTHPGEPGRHPRWRERRDLRHVPGQPGGRGGRHRWLDLRRGGGCRRRRDARHRPAPISADQRVSERLPAGPRPPIALDHVSRWYGNVVAVNDISFALGPGVTGLLGPNGAGKSTLLHLLAGLLAPRPGRSGSPGARLSAIRRSIATWDSCRSVRPCPAI
ncbi:MAG: ATP-binding cassette domain-containing protein [Candidatus Limnocylindrales bacterium]